MHDHGCFANDNSKQHGGKQIIMTPNDILLPIIIKNGLSYIKYYRPAAKQMRDITQEEFVTSKNDWNPSQYDDIEGTADLQT